MILKLQAKELMKTLSVGVDELSNARHNTFLLLTKRDFGIYGFLRMSSGKLSKLKLNLV